MKRFIVEKHSELLLLLIMVTAFLLRFWRFADIPFTFDELSAMSRTVYDNFRDLIKYGVVEGDTHPAGVQVFMYYWVRAFGEAEWVVKLPFIMAGLASVWVAYEIAKLWFNNTAAVLTAAYMASLQLFVMYSQIARPYASGLFLTLMMVFFWSRYLLKGYKIGSLAGFVIFAALSSYNHHFSLLFATIVGFTGLWFVEPGKKRQYMLAGVAIFVLYIPHLPVFFSQLQKGGIGGWLAKPSPWFLLQFVEWLFHYSVWVFLVLACVIGFLFFKSEKPPGTKKKKRIRLFMLFWFLLPVIIGYAYSVFKEPIIQYSLLIFSTPYLFMLMFSYLGPVKKKHLTLAVILILLTNSLTLIIKRQHYRVFYKQPFEHVVQRALELDRNYPGNVLILNNYIPYYTEYYFRKYGKAIPFFTVRNKNLSVTDLRNVLTEIKENLVITSGLEASRFPLIREQFPYWIGYDRGFTFQEYVLARNLPPDTDTWRTKLISEISFADEHNTDWKINNKYVLEDSVSADYIYKVSPGQPYSLSFTRTLNQITGHIYVFLDIEAEIKTSDSLTDAALVAELKNGKELLWWHSANFKEFGVKPGSWQKVYLTIDLQGALKDKDRIRNSDMLKTFLWNKNESQLLVRNVRISLRPGNPYRYVLFTNIPKVSRDELLSFSGVPE